MEIQSRLAAAIRTLATMLVLGFTTQAWAESWQRAAVGPDAYVRTVRIFNSTPSAGSTTLLLATLGAGVVKVVDSGGNITVTRHNGGLPHLRVRSISASDLNNIYAIMDGGGFYKTTDGGASWTAANGSGASKLGCLSTRNFGVRSPLEIWVLTACSRDSGVWRTLDGGATWARLGGATIPGDAAAGSITFNGTGGTTVALVSTGRDGIFRTMDNGATWVAVNNGLPTAEPGRLSVFNTVFGAHAGEVLAYVEGEGVYRSTDGGGNWIASNTGLPADIGSHGGLVRFNATTFFIGTDKGPIYRSADFGATWAAYGNSGLQEYTWYARGITFDAVPAKMWVHGARGLARSVDGGFAFTRVAVPEGFYNGAAIGADLTAAYLASGSVRKVPDVYATSFGGITDIGGALPGYVDNVVVDHTTAGVLYATIPSLGRIAKSMTDGASWFTYPQSFDHGSSPILEISLSNPNTLYMGRDNKYDTTAGGGFWKSIDGGQNWTLSSSGLALPAARQVNSIGQSLLASDIYLATDDGIYKTTDGGATWGPMLKVYDGTNAPLPFNSVRVDPADDLTVWASAVHLDPDGTVLPSSGIYKSVNGGTSWTLVYGGKRAIAVRPEANGRVVAGLNRTLGDPVFVASIDGGATWQPFIDGTTTMDANGLSRNRPHTDAHLAIGITASGLYVLSKPTLTVTVAGSGSVASSTAGVACPGTCSAQFFDYQLVALTATAAAGQTFLGWSGACSGTGACNVRMDAAKSVTATFSVNPALTASPTSLAFGGQSMNTTAPARSITITNTSGGSVTVSGVSVPAGYAVASNTCGTVAAGATCTITVTFTPGTEGAIGGSLQVSYTGGPTQVALTGTGERSLVTHYYRAILGRAPDAGGKAYWESEAARVAALGANVNETWYALATTFFVSPEYVAFNRDNTGFLTDLYNTFFNRPPDSGGLGYWNSLMAGGMPREIVLVSFMFSDEFTSFTRAIFGNTAARAEVDTVVDFYRGLLSRLPDSAGFNYWVGQFRAAQCSGPSAVYTQVEAISNAYANSPEYGARARSNAAFVGDMYNSFLRRGGDLAGVNYWISQLDSGARTRENVRQAFIATPEFGARVQAIINQGCMS